MKLLHGLPCPDRTWNGTCCAIVEPASGDRLLAAAPPYPKRYHHLVHLCAAALDQEPEHDYKKHARNDADNHLTFHVLPPFISC